MTTHRFSRAAVMAVAFGALVVSAACTAAPTGAPADKFAHVLSDQQLAQLRQCESGGNYSITNPSGAYRGAYQFSRQTWNGVAERHYPHLAGIDPAAAAPADQDAMARALWSERGSSPWPHCGRRV